MEVTAKDQPLIAPSGYKPVYIFTSLPSEADQGVDLVLDGTERGGHASAYVLVTEQDHAARRSQYSIAALTCSRFKRKSCMTKSMGSLAL